MGDPEEWRLFGEIQKAPAAWAERGAVHREVVDGLMSDRLVAAPTTSVFDGRQSTRPTSFRQSFILDAEVARQLGKYRFF